MRTAEEMYRLFLDFANASEEIRVVGLNGSRVNAKIKPDEFQDFDVVYLVNSLDSFLSNPSWVDYFGERTIMQTPDAMNGIVTAKDLRRFAYLMQFADGNRIDLSLRLVEDLAIYLEEDSLVEILLDKDNRVDSLPVPSEESHFITPPSRDDFVACHNEFWWVATYVAKGLRRGEQLYGIKHLHDCVLSELLTMIGRAVGIEHGYQINLGNSYKFLGRYLPEKAMREIYDLYRLDSIEHCWTALFGSFELMLRYSQQVEQYYDFPVYEDGKKVQDYISKLYEEAGNRKE